MFCYSPGTRPALQGWSCGTQYWQQQDDVAPSAAPLSALQAPQAIEEYFKSSTG